MSKRNKLSQKTKIELRLAGSGITYLGRIDETGEEPTAECRIDTYGGVTAFIPLSKLLGNCKIKHMIKTHLCSYVIPEGRVGFLLSYYHKVHKINRGLLTFPPESREKMREVMIGSPIGDFEKITVLKYCSEHEAPVSYKTTLSKLRLGTTSCPVCRTVEKEVRGRYYNHKELTFYVLEFCSVNDPSETFTKVGITAKTVKSRYAGHLVSGKDGPLYKLTRIRELYKLPTKTALDLEQSILHYFGDNRLKFSRDWAGQSECVTNVTFTTLGMPITSKYKEYSIKEE